MVEGFLIGLVLFDFGDFGEFAIVSDEALVPNILFLWAIVPLFVFWSARLLSLLAILPAIVLLVVLSFDLLFVLWGVAHIFFVENYR